MEEDKVPRQHLIRAVLSHKCDDPKQQVFTSRFDFAPVQVFSDGSQGKELVLHSGAKLIVKHLKHKKGHNNSKKDQAKDNCLEKRIDTQLNKSPEGDKCKIPHANELTRNNVQFEKINEVFVHALDGHLWFNTSNNSHDDNNSLPEVLASRIADLIMPKLKDQLDPN